MRISVAVPRADVSPSLIYKWRRDASADSGFARVLVMSTGDSAATASSPVVEVEFPNRRVRIPTSTPPELAAAVVKALAGR